MGLILHVYLLLTTTAHHRDCHYYDILTPLINKLSENFYYMPENYSQVNEVNSFDLNLAPLIKFYYYMNQVCNELSKVLWAYIHSFDRGRERLYAEYISIISLHFLLTINRRLYLPVSGVTGAPSRQWQRGEINHYRDWRCRHTRGKIWPRMWKRWPLTSREGGGGWSVVQMGRWGEGWSRFTEQEVT